MDRTTVAADLEGPSSDNGVVLEARRETRLVRWLAAAVLVAFFAGFGALGAALVQILLRLP